MNCLQCRQEIKPYEGSAPWVCPTGQRHVVETKKYYMDDAPSDPGPFIGGVATGANRQNSRTIIANLTPETRTMNGPNVQIVPGRKVEFIRGIYSTSDAEEQFYLDVKEKSGELCNEKRWAEVYLTDNQKNEIEKMNLAAERQKIEVMRNELLAMKQQERKQPTGDDLQAQVQQLEQELRNSAAEEEVRRGPGRPRKHPEMLGVS